MNILAKRAAARPAPKAAPPPDARGTGVWIDMHEAVIIVLDGGPPKVTRVTLDVGRHKAILKAKHHGVRAAGRVVSSEKREQTRLDEEMRRYLDRVMDAIGPAGTVVVLGPAQVGARLKRAMESDARWRTSAINLARTDRLTRGQMVAWVKRYFA